MEPTRKDLRSIILKLLAGKQEISIHDVARAAGLSVEGTAHRRAIQRALKELVEQKVIRAQGEARARTYTLAVEQAKRSEAPPLPKDEFQEIPLSEDSKNLLVYLAKPV